MSKRGSYTDSEGRKWAVMLPDEAIAGSESMGLPIGPPSLEPLGLPLEVEVRLHNQLYERELFTERDVKARRLHVQGAIQAALKVDVEKIVQLYRPPEGDDDGASRRQVKTASKRTKRGGTR
jgi:hypothetical protein